MQNNKLVVDNIPAEFLKALGEKATKDLFEKCRKVYDEGVWREDLTIVVIVSLQRKHNALDQRTISLFLHHMLQKFC
jgi:hypothetical protein